MPDDLSSIPGTYTKTLTSQNYPLTPSPPQHGPRHVCPQICTHTLLTYKQLLNCFLERKDPTLDFAACFSNPDFRPFPRLKLAERGTSKDSSCFTKIVNWGDEDSGALSPSNQY